MRGHSSITYARLDGGRVKVKAYSFIWGGREIYLLACTQYVAIVSTILRYFDET